MLEIVIFQLNRNILLTKVFITQFFLNISAISLTKKKIELFKWFGNLFLVAFFSKTKTNNFFLLEKKRTG